MTGVHLATVALLASVSCNAWADLRAFDVGPQHQQEVYRALSNALHPAQVGGGNPYGTVQQLPDGQILVNAQPQTLTQVEQIIAAIRARPVAAAPRVTLRYWAVLGARRTGNTPSTVGTAPPSALDDVLAELERFHSDVTFRVIGSAAVTSDSGQSGEVDGQTLKVGQATQVQGERLNADVRITLRGGGPPPGSPSDRVTLGELELRTTLQRGEFVVLGEGQLQGTLFDGPVFYIVHWAAN